MTQAGWWELELRVPLLLADELGHLLVEEGAEGVEIQSRDIVPPGIDPKDVEPEEARMLAAYNGSISDAALMELVQSATQPYEEHIRWRLRRREDDDWQQSWKVFFRPQQIGENLYVIPEWEKDHFDVPTGGMPIFIEPGMAFGTGNHATTSLCLRLIEEQLQQSSPQNFLDVGCGSGILSIAAARMGITDITAIDIDPESISATQENAARNNVTDHIQVSTTPISDIADEFDWVVANILAHILVSMAPHLIRKLGPHSTLLLSGVLREQRNEILETFLDTGRTIGVEIEIITELYQDDWAALLFRRI